MNEIVNLLNKNGLMVNNSDNGMEIDGNGFSYRIVFENNNYVMYEIDEYDNADYLSSSNNVNELLLLIAFITEKNKYFEDSMVSNKNELQELLSQNNEQELPYKLLQKYNLLFSVGDIIPFKLCVYNENDNYVFGFCSGDEFYESYKTTDYKDIFTIIFYAIKGYENFLKIFNELKKNNLIDDSLFMKMFKYYMATNINFYGNVKKIK